MSMAQEGARITHPAGRTTSLAERRNGVAEGGLAGRGGGGQFVEGGIDGLEGGFQLLQNAPRIGILEEMVDFEADTPRGFKYDRERPAHEPVLPTADPVVRKAHDDEGLDDIQYVDQHRLRSHQMYFFAGLCAVLSLPKLASGSLQDLL